MKQADARTLSEHLLREAQRFIIYPMRASRTKLNLAAHKVVEKGVATFAEWRKTFAPQVDAAVNEFWTSEVRLDQMYCTVLLQEVPNFVKRTQALRAIALSGIPNAEYFVYLREAAHCYISGLPQAAVALSRAAVENRLKEVCAKRFGLDAVENADLITLIDNVAVRGQILSKPHRDLAHLIRIAGNDVLHDEPTDSDAALQVVEAARDVIRALHGR
jgi:hypothetical protein